MKIHLILPALKERFSQPYRRIKYSLFPPLSLMTIAGLTPPEHEVIISDEHVADLDFSDTPDLVGMTVYISSAHRAYRIAAKYRKRGVPVVLGGIHPTTLPAEAKAHCDAVVIGEAEGVWGDLLADLQAGRLQPFYDGTRKKPRKDFPLPRRELMVRSEYLVPNTMTVSRGCPHNCSFCYKPSFFGRDYRFRPIAEVERELASFEGRHVFFLDDNLLANRRYGVALFRILRDLGKIWQAACSVDVADDAAFLRQAYRVGCRSLFIGFESLSKKSLLEADKRANAGRDYAQSIARIHDAGIMINGSFVFGFDDDEPGVFEETVAFIEETKIETATFHILTPYPGTALRERLLSEGRIIGNDWSHYDTRHVVFRPARLTPDQLQEGYEWCYKTCYRWCSILARSANSSLAGTLKRVLINVGYQKIDRVWDPMIKRHLVGMGLPVLERVLDMEFRQETKRLVQTEGTHQPVEALIGGGRA
jgi:radical SAM superfamily enzyme YgiQ (UPF0313 family)